jgi:hypothetical protein
MDDEHFNNCHPPKTKKKPPLMRLQFRKLKTENSRGPAATFK